ncbi:MAG: TetR/AcrR family transcriptional regulator, tetracycline repressor protein [Frankiaceae bacterium]|nr:TetR/AcrR family transcriptional regulator, tetracycline repressor protein [Frankiaceae bacterium]
MARPKARASLSKDEIVDVALGLIAEVGVDQLSMRQLSDRLGASLGATNRHVPTKEALLALCGRALYERSYRPRGPEDDPLDWVREQLVTLHELLISHPGMATYVVNQPDLVTPELVAAVQESLIDAGLSEAEADAARLVLYFYSAGVLVTDSAALLSAAGLSDPGVMFTAGIDYILRAGARVH